MRIWEYFIQYTGYFMRIWGYFMQIWGYMRIINTLNGW